MPSEPHSIRARTSAPERFAVLQRLRRLLGPLWHNLLLPWWRDYRWPIIGALWLLAFILGYIGIRQYYHDTQPPKPKTVLDCIYLSLQLFVLNWYDASPLPWELEFARFLAPVMAAYTALEALALVFFDQFQLLRVRRIRDHVIICGLGNKGLLLARAFHEQEMQVIVIEQDPDNEFIRVCREKNIVVLIGDADKPEILNKARAHQAKYLIAVCGDDSSNAGVAAHARQLAATEPGKMLTCITHIVDPDLWYLLRKWEIATNDAFRLQFFNVFDIGARALLNAFPPFSPTDEMPPAPHLLVVGSGNLGQSLVVHAARAWQNRPNATGERMQVTMIDKDTERIREFLHLRHPELEKVCNIVARQIDVSSTEFQRGDFLYDCTERCDISTVYVCVDKDALSLSAALALLHKIRDLHIPIIVRMNQNAGLATLLDQAEDSSRGYNTLHAFGLLERTCQPDLVLGGTIEVLARTMHETYVRDQKLTGATPQTNPALVDWDDLPEDMRESNRRQADHIGMKLQSIGCDIAPLTEWNAAAFQFTPDEIDHMAELEHIRWMEERRQQGWSLGPRDNEKKTNPSLVPWTSLPEDGKVFNRELVTGLPASLAKAGFQIYRLVAKPATTEIAAAIR